MRREGRQAEPVEPQLTAAGLRVATQRGRQIYSWYGADSLSDVAVYAFEAIEIQGASEKLIEHQCIVGQLICS